MWIVDTEYCCRSKLQKRVVLCLPPCTIAVVIVRGGVDMEASGYPAAVTAHKCSNLVSGRVTNFLLGNCVGVICTY